MSHNSLHTGLYSDIIMLLCGGLRAYNMMTFSILVPLALLKTALLALLLFGLWLSLFVTRLNSRPNIHSLVSRLPKWVDFSPTFWIWPEQSFHSLCALHCGILLCFSIATQIHFFCKHPLCTMLYVVNFKIWHHICKMSSSLFVHYHSFPLELSPKKRPRGRLWWLVGLILVVTCS